MIEVKIPTVGESISEVQVGQWLKQEGEWVNKDEDLVEIETEKASVQILAPVSGYLRNVLKQEEEFATVGDVIASIEPADAPNDAAPGTAAPADSAPATPAASGSASAPAPAASSAPGDGDKIMPAAQRMLDDFGLKASQVQATGPGGRLLKEDVQAFLRSGQGKPAAPPAAPAAVPAAPRQPVRDASLVTTGGHNRGEEIKPMSMIRRTIASRLVEAQQTAALLTTFNEINMRPVMELRKKYRDAFVDKHGVKLGFMSFFAKAAVEGLRRFPAVNAEVRGNNVVMRHYYDIGIAIGGGKGLVVPVLRNVEEMSFARIENSIAEFAERAGANQLQPADLDGGTFTISNGGIYGSLLSTPIVNPPQSGILGLHSIQERPVAERGEVVIRPMMYVALTYDHRVVDGREAVSFLKTIKDVMEDPARLFLEV
ncbi:Dihydrolipoyllysine-residue succinyltransferase component of 2-oxoglutarate dehydrogenase complex [Roseimaritima multifibrata]|uniref:Dihydrolipoyllysine-residue succinyltransferase component of 2-oxoglutarate dehydrogenase complex n=1 Tax=Roseimaritima multifibrata TaxID=1930274 RepID=A0A517MD15_9BACT|nr:Dihydrolipoyllysine-residue succinyltransferase component of 2-oxoglutarate dehydrogenase complex [Roseimaritima multifibrata]